MCITDRQHGYDNRQYLSMDLLVADAWISRNYQITESSWMVLNGFDFLLLNDVKEKDRKVEWRPGLKEEQIMREGNRQAER